MGVVRFGGLTFCGRFFYGAVSFACFVFFFLGGEGGRGLFSVVSLSGGSSLTFRIGQCLLSFLSSGDVSSIHTRKPASECFLRDRPIRVQARMNPESPNP